MLAYVKTFVLLAIFIVMSIGCVGNVIIHHKEKKQAIKEGRIEKKTSKLLFWKKKKKK